MIPYSWIILGGGGLVAGTLSGLLGIGGGVVLVSLLVTLGYAPVQAVGTSSMAILVTSVSGSFQNWRMGSLDFKRVAYLGIPSLITAQLGVYLATKLPSYLLLTMYGVLLLVNIYLVQLKQSLLNEENTKIQTFTLQTSIYRALIGSVAGFIAGLFGVGGGVILIPFQMMLLGEPIRVAIQTSLGVVVATAVSATVGHAAKGNVLFIEGAILALGGLIAAQFSTRLVPKISSKWINRIFRAFLSGLSIYIFWQAWTLTDSRSFFWSMGVIAACLCPVAMIVILYDDFRNLLREYKEFLESHQLDKKSHTLVRHSKQHFRPGPKTFVIPLLLLLVTLQSLLLVWINRSEIARLVSQFKFFSVAKNSDCSAPTNIAKDRLQYLQICTAMQDVLNVPDGQFFYGGTMGAAALRSEDFRKEIQVAHPGFRLRYLDPLSVAPDSATGIRMLINGELSFAESQRPLREVEYEQARMRGFTLRQIPIAMTGIAFFVHSDLQIAGLSLDQIQGIYTGKITNWQEVGGPNLPIVPVSQDIDVSGSTMSLLLQELPSAQQRLSENVLKVRDTTASLRNVGKTPGAIGFGIQALVFVQRSVRLLGLARWQSRNYVQPITPNQRVNKKALRDGTYPLIQRIFVVIRQDETLDEIAGMAYANLLLSEKGQSLIDQAGYLPIRSQEQLANSPSPQQSP
jgi:uncharacterized membrane protein YfcA/ABC-type phosphate transport system substrate-binding protein